MKILHLCPGADTGGQSIASRRAFLRHAPGDEVRVVTASLTYMAYETDLPWRSGNVEQMYDWADLVVFHNNPVHYQQLDRGRGKPALLHHHGTRFRQSPAAMWAAGVEIGATQVFSTADLMTLIPKGGKGVWQPQLVDRELMATLRAKHYLADGYVRIAHAPTDRLIKGTSHVIAAVERLASRLPVKLVLIERQKWTDCLKAKATADIYVDQFELGYGGNTVEAWALGMPVIANAADPKILTKMRRLHGTRELPFYQATVETLESALEALVTDAALRAEWAARGMRHVEAFHDDAIGVAAMQRLYAGVGPSAGGPSPVEYAAQQAAERDAHRYIPRRLRRRAALRAAAREAAA